MSRVVDIAGLKVYSALRMKEDYPETFALLAGRGVYPRLVLEGARKRGVRRILLIGFRGETERRLARLADETVWVHLGQLGRTFDALRSSGLKHVMMVGQIRPTHIFNLRFDAWTIQRLRALPVKNAHTIFGTVVDALHALGMNVLPASTFMEDHMPGVGCLTRRAPDERERNDIALGLDVARATSEIEIGQTVVIKDGMILAVEALEGTDRTIRRAGRIGGRGAVVVKVAKPGHDMRFDIPVVGPRTLRNLRRARASCLAFQAGRAIFLEAEKLVAGADRAGICMVGMADGRGDEA